jgi:hypothetical protein
MSDATATPAFPTQPDQVTPAWLTEQLRASGTIGSDQTVLSFTTTPVGEGVGMLGVIAKLTLAYDGGHGAVDTVIVKCATPNLANRAVGMAFRVYEREVRFLKELARHTREGLPGVYFADIEISSGDHIVVMEDLSAYRPGDQAAGCGADEAAFGIDVMAGLHAAWWGATDPALEWVPRIDSEMQLSGMSGGFAAGWEPAIAAFGHLLPEEIRGIGPRFQAAIPELHARMAQAPITLAHGDFRLDNILFGVEEGHYPMVLLDWQGLILSKGTQDLAYLLTQNVHIAERRAHERDLVARYHAKLVEHGVTGYTLEQCWEDYRLAALYLFNYVIVIAGTLDPGNERGRAFMSGMVERAGAAMVDLDLASLLP